MSITISTKSKKNAQGEIINPTKEDIRKYNEKYITIRKPSLKQDVKTVAGLVKNKITQPFKTAQLVRAVARKNKLNEYPMGLINQEKAHKRMTEFAKKGDMKGMREYARSQRDKIYK